MNKTKYVIVDGNAIIFSNLIQHSYMVGHNQKVDGAGFVYFNVDKDEDGNTIIICEAYGESISLGVKSRGEEDSKILTKQITNPYFY